MNEKTAITFKEEAECSGDKQSLISKTPDGQRLFCKETTKQYLQRSLTFEALQDLSGFTKYEFNIATSFSFQNSNDNPFYSNDTICIYNDDITKIHTIKQNSIDLIVTSPPYNVDINYNSHNDTMSYQDYLAFTKEWLNKCYGFLKSDGRFCLNIPLDKNKGGQQSVYADITTIAKQVGFKYHSTIIWNEQNISRRTAWGSWLSASAPYVIAPVEVIVVLYKNKWKKTSGSKKSDITKDEFVQWTNGVWNFSGESKKRVGHPAPYPVELALRCIKLFTFVGDSVLDPFLGSGSTLLACLETARKGIGIEIDKDYCLLSVKRIQELINMKQANLYET